MTWSAGAGHFSPSPCASPTCSLGGDPASKRPSSCGASRPGRVPRPGVRPCGLVDLAGLDRASVAAPLREPGGGGAAPRAEDEPGLGVLPDQRVSGSGGWRRGRGGRRWRWPGFAGLPGRWRVQAPGPPRLREGSIRLVHRAMSRIRVGVATPSEPPASGSALSVVRHGQPARTISSGAILVRAIDGIPPRPPQRGGVNHPNVGVEAA